MRVNFILSIDVVVDKKKENENGNKMIFVKHLYTFFPLFVLLAIFGVFFSGKNDK